MDKKIYIYESPDNGETIYKRESGKDKRTKLVLNKNELKKNDPAKESQDEINEGVLKSETTTYKFLNSILNYKIL